MQKNKVLIVEKDEDAAHNLERILQKQGYNIIAIAKDSTSAKHKIGFYVPDLVLIDITNNRQDGIALASYIRNKFSLPFIFLAADTDTDIIGDASKTEPYGYLIKPFNPIHLHATIQIAIYKSNQDKKKNANLNLLTTDNINLKKLVYGKKILNTPMVSFAYSYYFNTSTNETFYQGKRVTLTKKENLLISLLVANIGFPVTFDQAITYIWGDDGSSEHSVRTLVWRLRNKLQADIIKNASGIGYYIEDNIEASLNLAS